MFRSWCYLFLCCGIIGVTLAKYPLAPPRETCAGFPTIDVSRLPRFVISKFTDKAFNSVLLLDTLDPNFLSRVPIVKHIRKAVEGRPDQIEAFELRGRAPNCQDRILVIFRATQDRPGNPCVNVELIIPGGLETGKQHYRYKTIGPLYQSTSGSTTTEVLYFTPERDIITIVFCIERKENQCTKGLLCVTLRDAKQPLSRKRRNQILRMHERAGFFREFGVRASDIKSQDPRLNDCEFPSSILPRPKQQKITYNRSQSRRKNYKY